MPYLLGLFFYKNLNQINFNINQIALRLMTNVINLCGDDSAMVQEAITVI